MFTLRSQVTLCVMLSSPFLYVSCSDSTFSGASNKTPGSDQNNKRNVVASVAPVSSAMPVSSASADKGEINSANASVTLPAVCTPAPFALPSSEVLQAPEEIYNWKASGVTAKNTQVMSTPVVAKIMGDRSSIVFPAYFGHEYMNPSTLYAIDARSGAQQWAGDTPVMQSSAALGDIDGDGKSEVFALGFDGNVLQFSGATGKIVRSSSRPAVANIWLNAGVSLADLRGDGAVEIIAGNSVYSSKLEYQFSVGGASQLELVPGDVRSDISGTELISNYGLHRGSDGQAICAFALPIGRMGFGKVSKEDSTSIVVGSYPAALIGGTGNTSLSDALGYGRTTEIIAYRLSDCSQLFRIPFEGGGYAGLVTMADLDGDQRLEIGVPGVKFFTAYRADGTPMWKSAMDEADYLATGSTSFDLNGDGRSEILYNSVKYFKVIDGKSGKVIYQIENSNYTISEMPVVADIDDDGHSEIVVPASLYSTNGGVNSGIRVFRDPQKKWIGSRSIWNQAYYNATNVSDTGAITGFDAKAIWKSWLPSEHLVGYRNNIPRPRKTAENCHLK